jgi:hypothetical protein
VQKLIRDKETHSLLTKEGRWTDDYRKAWNLPDEAAAAAAKSKFKLQNVELYFGYFADSKSNWDFAVPLT